MSEKYKCVVRKLKIIMYVIVLCLLKITSLLFQNVRMQCLTVWNVWHLTIVQYVMATLWSIQQVMDVQVRSLIGNMYNC